MFIIECGFYNTDMEGITSIKWQHVSGVRIYLSVKLCLKPLNKQI
jgi:hypothetical protein